jgi:anti-sigma regulatory factor (Ser/Thr protein kinase)
VKAQVITDAPTVRLQLESRPQTLTIVRGMLGGVAELLAIDPELLDDLKTAVSEACNNVVLHAYGGEPGPMGVRLFVDDHRLRVTVEDEGIGLPDTSPDPAHGIGVSVIRALTEDVRFRARPGGGTEVEMEFSAHRQEQPLLQIPAAAAPDDDLLPERDGELVISLSPVTLLAGVLGRLARTLAATAHFSLDRFSDIYLVTDALAAHAIRAAARPRIGARLLAAERRLELVLGPFVNGSGAPLVQATGERSASPLLLVSDQVEVRPSDLGEFLRVVVIDHRR